jgi:S1-C subfamily serine protease
MSKGFQRIQVRLDLDQAIRATYVGGSPDHDLAIIRLRSTPQNLRPIPVGLSRDLAVGQAGLEDIDYRRRTLGEVKVAAEGSAVGNGDDFAQILQNFKIGQTETLEVRGVDEMREVVLATMDIS